MSTFAGDGDPTARPVLPPFTRRRDPLPTIGLVVVVAGVVNLVVTTWAYWDAFGGVLDGRSNVDRLRVAAAALNPLSAGLLLLGVVLASLRDLLGLLDTDPNPRPERDAARRIGATAALLLAVAGVVAAIDSAAIRDDVWFGSFENRWQSTLGYLAAAAVGAVTVWTVNRKDRPVPPAGAEDEIWT